ncbi:MAG: TIM barrel protein [Chloroflexaceae bacterium]|nr:TIM barrel protein [Chloroflexaceae bacterium]
MSDLPPLRFSVCIEKIFEELPFEQRMEHIKDHGFTAFEFWGRDRRDMNITLALKMALRLEVVAFLGSSASLVDPAQRAQFENDIKRSASLAVDLSCDNLIIHSGPKLPGVPRERQRDSLVEGIRSVLDIAGDAGVTLLLEPLNAIDFTSPYLTSSDEGFDIIRELNHPRVRLLFDVYNQQISEGNLSTRMIKNLDLIGHIHVADVPGRREPGTGEINYRYLFKLLRKHGYRGYIGLDYIPQTDSKVSLEAMRVMMKQLED